MKNDDELLDEIIAHLRSESIPEMPPQLAAPQAPRRRNWMWAAVGAGALAASLAGLLLWRSQLSQAPARGLPDVVQQPDAPTAGGAEQVVVRNVDLAAPLAELTARLDAVDAEIAELRRQAALLDARRLADKLSRSLAQK